MKINKAYNSVSLREATDLVKAVGDKVTCLFSGEMGIGKSSILSAIKRDLGDSYYYCYADMTTKADAGDFQGPKVRTIDGMDVWSFVPSEEFGFHLDKPIVLMLDEIGKASKSVLNACLRLMLERKLGTHALPEGSLVFATTNLSMEGLGDNIPPHARNRVCQMKIRKPTAMEWIEDYAIPRGLNPIVIGTVMEFPQMLQSCEECEDPSNNPYINHPKSPRTAFVTHRSMEKASEVLNATGGFSDNVRIHALMGLIGEAAAMDMMTMVRLDQDLPTWERIMADPVNATVPKSGVASCMIVAKAAMRLDKDTFGAWMTYLDRLPKETQALFARTIMRGDKKQIAATFRPFAEWATANMYLFS